MKELDHLLPADVAEVSQHYAKVLLLLTPLQQHEDLNCWGRGKRGREREREGEKGRQRERERDKCVCLSIYDTDTVQQKAEFAKISRSSHHLTCICYTIFHSYLVKLSSQALQKSPPQISNEIRNPLLTPPRYQRKTYSSVSVLLSMSVLKDGWSLESFLRSKWLH